MCIVRNSYDDIPYVTRACEIFQRALKLNSVLCQKNVKLNTSYSLFNILPSIHSISHLKGHKKVLSRKQKHWSTSCTPNKGKNESEAFFFRCWSHMGHWWHQEKMRQGRVLIAFIFINKGDFVDYVINFAYLKGSLLLFVTWLCWWKLRLKSLIPSCFNENNTGSWREVSMYALSNSVDSLSSTLRLHS